MTVYEDGTVDMWDSCNLTLLQDINGYWPTRQSTPDHVIRASVKWYKAEDAFIDGLHVKFHQFICYEDNATVS